MKRKPKSNFRVLWHPVDPENRIALKKKWDELPESLRAKQQLYGRTELGCGATIGVMPKCDFGCQACYLGKGANQTPPISLQAAKEQMRVLRSYLGRHGNLQLTDGEVSLRPVEDLLELLRFAREFELVPMLMTHGDTFRRRPDLLHRLVVDGGLRELSLHIDVTQRGRWGKEYENATNEDELMPLRNEFAELIRRMRKKTGCKLRVASTITVTHQNLVSLPKVVQWFAKNSDVFRLLSLQPIAQIGRTKIDLNNRVDIGVLWAKIGDGILGLNQSDRIPEYCWWMGHPACNQILTGLVFRQRGTEFEFHPLSSAVSAFDERVLMELTRRFGGAKFRVDNLWSAALRIIGMTIRAPRLMTWTLPRYALHWRKRIAPGNFFRFAWRLGRGHSRLHRFTVVSHHFMNKQQIATSEGAERIRQCVFRVALNENLISMCEFNANGHRDRFYQTLTEWQKKKPKEETVLLPTTHKSQKDFSA